jgi:hypothetical protein
MTFVRYYTKNQLHHRYENYVNERSQLHRSTVLKHFTAWELQAVKKAKQSRQLVNNSHNVKWKLHSNHYSHSVTEGVRNSLKTGDNVGPLGTTKVVGGGKKKQFSLNVVAYSRGKCMRASSLNPFRSRRRFRFGQHHKFQRLNAP